MYGNPKQPHTHLYIYLLGVHKHTPQKHFQQREGNTDGPAIQTDVVADDGSRVQHRQQCSTQPLGMCWDGVGSGEAHNQQHFFFNPETRQDVKWGVMRSPCCKGMRTEETQ